MFSIRWFGILILVAGMLTPRPVLAVPAQIVTSAAQTPPIYVKISAGYSHTCALTNTGVVRCWGSNEYGQLGNGLKIDRSTPVDVEGLAAGFTAVAAGYNHTCAVTATGGVKCWGNNRLGELGDGTLRASSIPVDVIGLDTQVTALVVVGENFNGTSHTCALTSAGGVKCWGAGYGSTPVDIEGLSTGIIALGSGESHTCVLTNTGGVKCWGQNKWGQLGDGTYVDQSTLVNVIGLESGVTFLATGKAYNCAVTEAGQVVCWGENYGDPQVVTGQNGGFIAVSAGRYHTCALTSAGGVKCWGYNYDGELGNGSTYYGRIDHMVDVVGLASGISTVAAGGMHTCALTDAGGIKCWGSNDFGQLGAGTILRQSIPMDVSGLAGGYTILAAGWDYTCAMAGLNQVKCWGYNGMGELGDGTTNNRRTPVDVVWNGSGSTVPMELNGGTPDKITALAAGGAHACALTGSGGLKCWGYNSEGQLGIGIINSYSLTPLNVIGLESGVTAVAARGFHTCALTSSGGVKCWGDNSLGQLGDGTTTTRSSPVDVTGLASGVIALAAGETFTCALTQAGGVLCWGYNAWGQLGNGTFHNSLTPVQVSGLTSGVTAITAGTFHTCAAMMTGGVKCWGDNRHGQLGDGTTAIHSLPQDVQDLTSGVIALAAGENHTCALTSSSGLKCWGGNDYGQLGDGTLTQRSTPVDVVGMTGGITALAAGARHTCALVNIGRPKCWGDDHAGQLGLGSLIMSPVPVDVVEGTPLLNYSSGKPGSYFTVTGKNFQPRSAMSVAVNGQVLSPSLQVNETGGFLFFLNTSAAGPGQYLVTVSANSSASASFSLDPNSTLRLQEGGGTTLNVPHQEEVVQKKYFMPMITR